MKRIFVPLLGETGDRMALDTAGRLAGPSGGHVDAVLLRRDPRDVLPIVGEGFGAAMVDEIMAAAETPAKDQEAAAQATFDAWVADSGAEVGDRTAVDRLTASLETQVGPVPGLERAPSRLADVTVCARGGKDGNPDRAALIETAVMDSGRPVVLASEGDAGTIGSNVVVAWNGSAEAARAVSMSMPLLQRAQRVTVVTVDDGDVSADPQAMTQTLRMNGIAADGVTAVLDRAGVAATLEAEAARQGADLLLIGAYSHSRVREFVLGGVTDDALTEGSVAMMLAR